GAVHAVPRAAPPGRLRRADPARVAPPLLPPLHRARAVRDEPRHPHRRRRPPRGRARRSRRGRPHRGRRRPLPMSDSRPVSERRADVARLDLRRVHPLLRFGTASDRFAAWMGQVYPRDVWADKVSTRSKRAGEETFEERLLPVASVEDYFLHFGVLELDFTFYRPLLEADGR